MRFSDLVAVSDRPAQAEPAIRRPIAEQAAPQLPSDLANNGFVTALVDDRRSRRLGTSRRSFLRNSFIASAATAAASMTSLFGPARRVAAQTGVVGEYPRRILTFCPPYNANDNCQPGCGSSPICTDCCGSDGFFRNDPANGYSLYAGGCGDGDIADGWIWRYNDVCGSCAVIEYRCSDGYVQTDTGPAPFICRTVTYCEPLPEGAATNDQPDAAVQTNWQPAGALERAVDNGGSVSLTGWIADATGQPVDMRILANNQIVHVGKAGLARPDVAGSVRGAGPNTGYSVSFPLEPGRYTLCVNALRGAISVTIGCVELTVGSGQVVQGGSATGTAIGGLDDAPAADPTPTPTAGDAADGDADSSPDEADDGSEDAADAAAADAADTDALVPVTDLASATVTVGAAQIIRRSDATTGFVSGWAGDADTDEPAWVEVLVDGEPTAVLRPELPRPDVEAAYPEVGATTGFAGSFALPDDEALVRVDVVDPADGRRRSIGRRRIGAAIEDATDESETDKNPTGRPSSSGDPTTPTDVVWGALDDITVVDGEVVATGWALAANELDRVVGLRMIVSGLVAEGETGLDHPEARRIYGVDHPCGFELRLAVPAGEHTVIIEAATLQGSQQLLAEPLSIA